MACGHWVRRKRKHTGGAVGVSPVAKIEQMYLMDRELWEIKLNRVCRRSTA